MKYISILGLMILAGCGSISAGTKWLQYENDKLKEERRQMDFDRRADRWALSWLGDIAPGAGVGGVVSVLAGFYGHSKGRRKPRKEKGPANE